LLKFYRLLEVNTWQQEILLQKQVQIKALILCLRLPTKEEGERKGGVRNAGEGLPAFEVQVLKRTGDSCSNSERA
jgi:hypothetical protein